MRKKVSFFLLLLMACLGEPILAQSDTLNFSLDKAVEIIESRRLQFRQGTHFTRFTADSLGLFQAIGLSAGAILKQAAGVYLRDYGGHGGVQTLSIRGFAANQTQVTINGVPYQSAQNGVVNFAKIFGEDYQQISLYKGAADASLNPLGGLADFRIAPQQTGLRLKLGLGSFGEQQVMLRSDFVKEKTALRVALHFQEATDNYPYELNGESGKRAYAAFQRSQYQVFGKRELGKGYQLSYLGTGQLSEQQVPGPVLTGQVPIEEGLLIEDDHFHYLKLERFRARSAALLPDHWEALVRYHHNTLEYALPRQTQQYRNHDFFAQAQASYLGTRQRLELSLQYQANLLFGNNLAIDFVPVGQVSRGQLNLGALHQWVKPLDSLGLRLKTESILRFNYLQQYGLLPNAGFRAHLGQADRSEAFVGGHTGYRLPAFNELYYFSYGNAGLQPERVVEVEGGGVWRKTLLLPFSLKLNAFFNQTRNKIISVPINPARWSTLAVGLSQSLGLEAALDISLGARGRVYYHHTLQDVRDLSRAEKPFLPYTPPEIINYGLSWQGERLRFQLHAAYSSWRFALLQNGADSYLPPYHILDASMGYLIKMKKISYLIVGEVENVGNVSYAVIRSYPMPPRMFRLALILKY